MRTTFDEYFQKLEDENEMFAYQINEEEELELLKRTLARKIVTRKQVTCLFVKRSSIACMIES